MHTHQTRNLALAGALAVVAVLLTLSYVGSAGAHKASTGPAATVYVATRDIAVGTPGAVAMKEVRPVQVPASTVGPRAVTSRDDLAGLVAVQAIYSGEQVSLLRFASLRQQGALADLHGTLRAVEVSGDANQLLAGVAHDGDHVDVVASVPDPSSADRHYVRTVLRNIVLLQAAQQPGGSSSGGSDSYSAVLRLTDAQERSLFYVFKNGDWALVLRPVLRPRDGSDSTVTFGTILRGGE